MRMWAMNLGKPVSIPSLNDAMAIELGANLLGEAIIFIIAAGILLLEYTRQVRKETAKEAARQEEVSNIQYTIQELYFQAERQDAQIRELLRAVSDLEHKVVKIPWRGQGTEHPPESSIGPDSRDRNLDSLDEIRYYYHSNNYRTKNLKYAWPERRGIIFTAVAYLSNDVFREPN